MSETATLALSELRGLIVKAARGAGSSWGLAEEAGWAAEWLARRGMPAADWAAAWFAARIEGRIGPVEIGVALADAYTSPLEIKGKEIPDGLEAPGYLLPFLHRIARGGVSVAIVSSHGQVACVSSSGRVVFGPCWRPRSDGWWLTDAADAEPRALEAVRPDVSRSVLECLEGLALRTTVPGSATSRRDAGSTGGDND